MTPENEDQEREMREAEVPTFDALSDLHAYIEGLVEREHDYGTCVYAMSMAAVATFNYVAHRLGVTGFQASCADLDILRRTRRLKGPFMLLDGEKALFPQYDLEKEVHEWLHSADLRSWLAKEARRLLDERDLTAPAVAAHWRKLVEETPQ